MPLGGTRRVGGLLGVAGRLSGTVSPFKRSSIPPHKTRPDSPVPTLQGPCDLSQKWRGNLRFLPQPEMRPSSIKTNPVPREG